MIWALGDTWTLTGRALAHWARRPGPLLVSLLFPVLVVLMFNYLLGGQMQVPGGGEYVEFLLPGMLALTMVFGVEATMLAVSTDAQRGITDRFRSLPMSSPAVLAGRALADLLNSAVGITVLAACSWAGGGAKEWPRPRSPSHCCSRCGSR